MNPERWAADLFSNVKDFSLHVLDFVHEKSSSSNAPATPPVQTLGDRLGRLINRNRAAIGLGSAAIFLAGLSYYKRYDYVKKRRAPRAPNHQKTQVVVLSAWNSLASIVAHDLDRRGFIVVVLVRDASEAATVSLQQRPYIQSLIVTQNEAVERFLSSFSNQKGPTEYALRLRGLVLVPTGDSLYTPIENISKDAWFHAFQQLSESFANVSRLIPVLKDQKSRIIGLSHGILSAYEPPNYAIPSILSSSIETFLHTLKRESGLRVVCIKLGNLSFLNYDHSGPVAGRYAPSVCTERKVLNKIFDCLLDFWSTPNRHVGSRTFFLIHVSRFLPTCVLDVMFSFFHKTKNLSCALVKRV
ncbi:DUF1776 family protein [Schizosaccharomyces octosporus yFS286]|uniref:DUF1776 family protein n=1 Tax=Schizosaccharomyces octosporus (strain yFS286) TaxID=483514 RepID=S9PWF9_SCHOY|nr:DUF1776 family protein [Schizosaccharomyces octosporus yFS286]EPX73426.1 DUF1776 family protein [Schizosaccharomyces octosporus yFS286]